MNYSELLHDFMDGALDTSREDALFSVLVNNEDLRAEFREMLAIRGAVNADKLAFIPSTGATQSIFSELGFSAAGGALSQAAPGAAASAGWFATLGSFASRYSQAFIAGAGSAIATSLVFFAVLALDTDGSSDALADLDTERAHNWERINSIPIMESSSSDIAEVSERSETIREVIRYVEVPRPVAAVPSTSDSNNETPLPESKEQRETPVIDASRVINSPALAADNAAAFQPAVSVNETAAQVHSLAASKYDLSSYLVPEKYINVSFELRGSAANTYPSTDVPTGSDPLFNNMAFNVMFHWDENFAIGGEFSQEVFSQVFYDGHGDHTVRYEQKPKIFWGGVAGRYYPWSDQGTFAPFVHTVLGFANVGAVGKVIIGTSFTPEQQLRMTLGLEGSGLMFSHEQSTYFSRKLGLTYGISLKL